MIHARTWTICLLLTFGCSSLAQNQAGGAGHPSVPAQHARVKDNVYSDDLAKLTLTLDPKLKYLGSFPFDIKGIAGGYRYVWGEFDGEKHLRRTFIVQAEGYCPDNQLSYHWDTPAPVQLAGDTYQHVVFIYDNDESARERPGNESDLTAHFMYDHGYQWDSQLVMSRFARIVDESKKNEIIFFYFDNLANYTTKRVADFPQEPKTTEQKAILEAVDANSRKAFTVAH